MICQYCGKEKYIYPYRKGIAKYCSYECRNKSMIGNPSPKYKGIILVCKYCKKNFIPSNGHYDRKYCNQSCYGKSYRGYEPPQLAMNRGKKPRTYHLNNNRKLHAGQEYKDWRNKIFERDDYTCQECDNRGGKLNAHHIIPYAQDYKLWFKLNNGITLCVECHKKTDSYGWKNYWNNYIAQKRIDIELNQMKLF